MFNDAFQQSLDHTHATQFTILSAATEAALLLMGSAFVIIRLRTVWRAWLMLSFMLVFVSGIVPYLISFVMIKAISPMASAFGAALFLSFPAEVISIVTLISMVAWLEIVGSNKPPEGAALPRQPTRTSYSSLGYVGCFVHAIACCAFSLYGEYVLLD